MKSARFDGLVFLAFGCVMFALGGFAMQRAASVTVIDFRAVYYSARCLLQHSDPYKESELLRVYQAEEGDRPSDPAYVRRLVTVCVNLPTAFIVLIPFAMLPWGVAHVLWVLFIGISVVLAACLMWDVAADYAPLLSGVLICFFLLSSLMLLDVANTAGIVVGLCVVGVWCFLRERFVPAGILCLAISLIIKPHDAGFVWLYLLLAGGVHRKRALQTLVLAVILGLPGLLWVSHVAPNWVQELHPNLSITAARGDVNDPGPTSASRNTPDSIIDLQSVISVFWDDPRIYNPVTYLICAPLLAVWMIVTLRARTSPASSWMALAAAAAFSMLPVYHRQDDARLLLLAVPACAILWAEGGLTGRLGLLLTAAGFLLNGDIPTAMRISLFRHILASAKGLPGEIATVVLARPVPLILLAIGIFYLWIYAKRAQPQAAPQQSESSEETMIYANGPSSMHEY